MPPVDIAVPTILCCFSLPPMNYIYNEGPHGHTRVKPFLASRHGVFQNWPPEDVHAFSGRFKLIQLNLGRVLITSY